MNFQVPHKGRNFLHYLSDYKLFHKEYGPCISLDDERNYFLGARSACPLLLAGYLLGSLSDHGDGGIIFL
jgi:hypothetical protein